MASSPHTAWNQPLLAVHKQSGYLCFVQYFVIGFLEFVFDFVAYKCSGAY